MEKSQNPEPFIEEYDDVQLSDSSFEENASFNDLDESNSKDIETLWPQFLEWLSKDRPNLGSFLSQAQIVSSSTASIDLKYSQNYRFPYMEITKRHNREQIKKLLHQFAGSAVEIRINLDNKVSENQEQNYFNNASNMLSTINDEIEREPIIRNILDIFDGEVIN